MPFITVRTVKGALNEEEKERIKEQITNTMVEVEGGGNPDFRQHVWVLIEEVEAANWSIGGMTPTVEMIQAIKQAAPASSE